MWFLFRYGNFICHRFQTPKVLFSCNYESKYNTKYDKKEKHSTFVTCGKHLFCTIIWQKEIYLLPYLLSYRRVSENRNAIFRHPTIYFQMPHNMTASMTENSTAGISVVFIPVSYLLSYCIHFPLLLYLLSYCRASEHGVRCQTPPNMTTSITDTPSTTCHICCIWQCLMTEDPFLDATTRCLKMVATENATPETRTWPSFRTD